MNLLPVFALAFTALYHEDPKPAAKPAQEKLPTPEQRLENSPRHPEWLDVAGKDRTVRCFVGVPEVKTKAGVVVVLHENKGLNDWVRSAILATKSSAIGPTASSTLIAIHRSPAEP